MSVANDVSVEDLRADQASLRALLTRFELAGDPAERRDMMRLATDLFSVHAELQERLNLGGAQQRTLQAIIYLMEQLETTDPASKLYLARGLELKRLLEEYLAFEERTLAPVRALLKPEKYNLD